MQEEHVTQMIFISVLHQSNLRCCVGKEILNHSFNVNSPASSPLTHTKTTNLKWKKINCLENILFRLCININITNYCIEAHKWKNWTELDWYVPEAGLKFNPLKTSFLLLFTLNNIYNCLCPNRTIKRMAASCP